MDNDLCIHLIDGYGVCSKPQSHIVHQPNNISDREHRFERQVQGKMTTVQLSKRNLKKTARRSGKTVQELQIILEMARIKGKKSVSVKFEEKN